jgi:hypothetical protein
MLRGLIAAGILLAGFGAAAQESTNVQFEQRPNSLVIRAKIYKDDGDRVVETGELIAEEKYFATQGNGIPVTAFTLVTVCALDFPVATTCAASQLSPTLPRFFVDKAEGIGINSASDDSANRRRINRRTGSESAERMSLTFNCTDASCGPSITSGRIILNKLTGTSPTVFLYTTLGGTVVGSRITVAPGGANPAGITATRSSSGTVVINLSPVALEGRPAFDGFQIGTGNASTRFTFRFADMSFAQPQPDFVDFGCRIDLAQTGVPDGFKFTLPATSSEKFCPDGNDGVLKLGCSGTIPDYTGGAVTSAAGVVCRISGSQCGLDGVFDADVKSIDVTAGGLATLACEATIGG